MSECSILKSCCGWPHYELWGICEEKHDVNSGSFAAKQDVTIETICIRFNFTAQLGSLALRGE